MRILVTGAAGFLGSACVRAAAAAGCTARAMVRRADSRGDWPDGASIEIVVADLGQERADLAAAVRGADAVIHCAAATSEAAGDPAKSRAVNVLGTRRLFEAAQRAGVSRWIQISSMSAHAGSTSIYGTTKLAADAVLREAGGFSMPAWTILRPSLIYGPGEKGLAARMVATMRKLPVLPVVGSGRELLRPIYVDDVARAAMHAIKNEAAIGQTYMVGGADEVSFNEFMRELSKASGVKRMAVHLPIPLCWLIARVLAKISKNPPLTVDNVLGVKQMQRVEQSAAERDLSYEPLGLEEGLSRSFK